MNNRLTITSFFKKYREQIPYSLPLFRKAVISNLDKLDGVVLVLENKSRNTYKILNPDRLLELIKRGEIK